MIKNRIGRRCADTEENLTFWKHVENISEEVRHWPKWMGGEGVEPLQCPTCKKAWPEEKS